MKSLPTLEAYYEDLLYNILPQVYRSRDATGDLQQFMAVFGHEVARLRANFETLWRDFYIDSCQDWVIPYIADLVDTTILFNEGARNRADVKNTMKWRRQKGTLAGLEDITAEIGGCGARAVEMMARLVWSQNLNHLRMDAVQAVDLANGARITRLRTPFDPACHSVDLRLPNGSVGAYQIANVLFSEWMIPSQPWTGTEPAKFAAGRYFFNPLGRNQVLFAGGDAATACATSAATTPDATADICYPNVTDIPIRGRDFARHPRVYFGQPDGFTVYEDGIAAAGWVATAPPASAPAIIFTDLLAGDGLRMADPTLFGGPSKRFRITAVRLANQTNLVDGVQVPVTIDPAGPFANNYKLDNEAGDLDTTAFAYSAGVPFNPAAPDYHMPFLTLRIERVAADTDFPECELVVRDPEGHPLLVFLPARPGMAAADQFHVYAATDGSTYFARADHGVGTIDRNPNSASFGAFLPGHLARVAAGQVHPRSGVRPYTPRKPVYRKLCCWDQPLLDPPKSGEVAFDPERGRFAFPTGEEPKGVLTVDFRFAITGSVGAGPYFRGNLAPATHQVGKASHWPYQTIQAALNAAAGSASPVIVEIEDSRIYAEALSIAGNYPSGLTLRAAALQMPVIHPPAGDAIHVTGAMPTLALDGLVITGGALTMAAPVPALSVTYCSLDPAGSSLSCSPAATGGALQIANSIVGPVTASANATTLTMADSIAQHTAGGDAISCQAALKIDRTTVLGAAAMQSLTASNCIFAGALAIANVAHSCMRYTCNPANAPAVKRFQCTTAVPVFVSARFGHPAYSHLAGTTSAAIRSGAENGGEMGGFYQAGLPWRTQNVQIKLQEYLPAGLRAAFAEVLPLRPFAGVRTI